MAIFMIGSGMMADMVQSHSGSFDLLFKSVILGGISIGEQLHHLSLPLGRVAELLSNGGAKRIDG